MGERDPERDEGLEPVESDEPSDAEAEDMNEPPPGSGGNEGGADYGGPSPPPPA
jgi:hypothetical protein